MGGTGEGKGREENGIWGMEGGAGGKDGGCDVAGKGREVGG